MATSSSQAVSIRPEPCLTREHIETVLDQSLQAEPSAQGTALQMTEWTEKFIFQQHFDNESGRLVTKSYSKKERQKLMQEHCQALCTAASDPNDNINKLEVVFSELVTGCGFCILPDDRDLIVQQVLSTFCDRLPARPPALPEPLNQIPACYFRSTHHTWQELHVVALVPRNLIRIVIHIWVSELYGTGGETTRMQQLALNDTAELMTLISASSSSSWLEADTTSKFIVRAYLWNFWHRLRTLHMYTSLKTFQFGSILYEGLQTNLNVNNFYPCPGLKMAQLTRDLSEEGRSRNACTWILELTRSQSNTFGIDFRLLHERYAAVLSHEPARCRPNSDQPCDGQHPHNCLRFYGAKIEDQSAHDDMCDCASRSRPRLPWDRESYISTNGPRAVTISHRGDINDIKYQMATKKTMAISHVWSHGQGGRPENGINVCLHERYCQVAAQLGCDSYWMDTMCIPNNHELRQEAILQINHVFATSQAVLVCDRDIMKIDVSELTLSLQEAIIAAMVFSEWNTRAWTFLESIMGRRSIILLCKDRRTVKVEEILQQVLRKGRIDIAVFAWHISHMITSCAGFLERTQVEESANWPLLSVSGLGSSLSYRPASRSGDEFVIWSLLAYPDKPPQNDAESFWRSFEHQFIPTAYLMSSAKRLNVKGLNWAPSTPYAAGRDNTSFPRTFYRPGDGIGTELGRIESDGLWARWWRYELGFRFPGKLNSRPESRIQEELSKIESKFVPMFHYGILLRPIYNLSLSPHLLSNDMGYAAQGKLVAIAISRKLTRKQRQTSYHVETSTCYRWRWRGVYEWPDDVELPFPDRSDKAAGFSIYHLLWLG